ncbi:unnamed protein product [Arctogadus glacialis]
MEGQVAAPHPVKRAWRSANLEGLETAEVLEATAGLEVEANLEVLESVGLEGLEAVVETNLEGLEAAVGSNLEGLEAVVETNLEGLEAVVGTNLEVPAVASTWRRSAWRARRRRPGGPGGGVLEGPAAASWRARRRRPGGPGRGVLEGPAEASWRARRRRPGGPGGGVLQGPPALIEGVTGDEDHCSGADDPPPPTHLSGEASSWCRRSNLHLFEGTKQLDD